MRRARLDLRHHPSAGLIRSWHRRHVDASDLIEIESIEACLDDSGAGEAVLDLVEDVALCDDKTVMVSSAVDPVAHLAARVAGGAESWVAEHLARWRSLGASFDIGRDTAGTFGLNAMRKAWIDSDLLEQLAMRQLAEEGFLNAQNQPALRSLMSRGLVHRERGALVLRGDLSNFVRREVPAETVLRWEQEGKRSPWSRLRVPLGLVLIGMVLFLAYRQNELVSRTIAALTALTAATPLLPRFFPSKRAGTGVL